MTCLSTLLLSLSSSVTGVMCVSVSCKNGPRIFLNMNKVLNKQLAGEDIGLSEKSIKGKPFAFLKSYF